MKLETYDKCVKKYPDFNQYTKEIDPSIFQSQLNNSHNQIRAYDLMIANVPAMGASIVANGQQSPCTITYDVFNQPQLADGFTRTSACLEQQLPVKVNDYFHHKMKWTEDEWYDYVCKQNDHFPHEGNSSADVKRQVAIRCTNGYFNRTAGFTYDRDPEKWMDIACKRMLKVYSNSTTDYKTYFNWIANVQVGKPNGKLHPYPAKEAMQFVKANIGQLPFKWSGNQVGDESYGNTIYFATDLRNIRKSILPAAFTQTATSTPVNVYVLIYLSPRAMAGKDDKGVAKERQNFRNEIATINNHPLLKGPLVKGMWFLPQIRSQDNMYKFLP